MVVKKEGIEVLWYNSYEISFVFIMIKILEKEMWWLHVRDEEK